MTKGGLMELLKDVPDDMRLAPLFRDLEGRLRVVEKSTEVVVGKSLSGEPLANIILVEAGHLVPSSERAEKMEGALIQIKSLEEGMPHSCWAITQEKLFEAVRLANEALGTAEEERELI